MIREAYCSFEVAKLLKDKGFDEPCNHYYLYNRMKEVNYYERNSETQYLEEAEHCMAPTHQMAMAWLREEKYIPIFIVPAKDDIGNLQYMADVWTWNEDEGLYEPVWCTADDVYEKAVEPALKYVLENLI